MKPSKKKLDPSFRTSATEVSARPAAGRPKASGISPSTQQGDDVIRSQPEVSLDAMARPENDGGEGLLSGMPREGEAEGVDRVSSSKTVAPHRPG